jgi:hypothetical protein
MQSYLVVYQDFTNAPKWVVLPANDDTLESAIEIAISTIQWNEAGEYYVVERTKA